MLVFRSLSPARWARRQSPMALLVVRLLLVANTILLVVVGGLCFAFFARPGGFVAAGVAWLGAGGLLSLVPYTNPRRGETSRW